MQAWLDSFVIVNLAGMYTELCLPCICLYLTFFFPLARPIPTCKNHTVVIHR